MIKIAGPRSTQNWETWGEVLATTLVSSEEIGMAILYLADVASGAANPRYWDMPVCEKIGNELWREPIANVCHNLGLTEVADDERSSGTSWSTMQREALPEEW